MKVKIGTCIIDFDDCKSIDLLKTEQDNVGVCIEFNDGTKKVAELNNEFSVRTFLNGLSLVTNTNITISEIEQDLDVKIL